jgi:hypothetical protein
LAGPPRHSAAVTIPLIVSAEFNAARLPTRAPRRILLSGDTHTATPGRVRFVAGPVELAQTARSTWVTLTRTGSFSDPRYGRFEITPAMLAEMVQNFEARVLGQDVFIDVSHRPGDGAAGKVLRLAIEGSKLRALVEWTTFGIEAVRERGFTYLSAEYHEQWRDNERGEAHGCVLLGAGLTTRPVVKHLDPVALASLDASAADEGDDDVKTALHPRIARDLFLLQKDTMDKHLQALRTKLLAQGLTEDQIKPILAAAQKQLEQAGADEAKCLALVEGFAAAGAAAAAELKKLASTAPTGSVAPPFNFAPTIALGADAATLAKAVDDGVTRQLAEREAAATKAAGDLAAKVKLLSDTVAENKSLAEPDKAELLKYLQPLVAATDSDERVRSLAQFGLEQATRRSAAAQLATLGYRTPSGTVHISVDGTNQVKSLQEQVDRRLGITGASEARRFERTGGKLLAHNKEFAERCLAQFDAEQGERLALEHKALAGGTGIITDAKVPAIFERTVLRESLFSLQGLALVDTGTVPFANVVTVPFSYRDTTAAGIGSTRVYELQGIPRAGYIQDAEEARPTPQKLSFRITNELRYLLAASPIDYDPLAENLRNITRIVGEDTDRLIHNEILNATDESGAVTITDTLTAQVNGTNRIFVSTQFPVVRPRRQFDLKGVQQGSTLNPVTVTLNSVVRSEYVSGVTLAAGLYYIADWNLGELRFVNEAGVLQTPTSGWALTWAYSHTTNVVRKDLDLSGLLKLEDVYDDVLLRIGARKVVIENDRYYTADTLLMSGAVDNALTQATTFEANSARSGTGLNADGSLGVVKGIPVFNTRAPGLLMGDTRILVGERRNTRFRMMRALQMTEMTQARDANGLFVGAQESYGEQWVLLHTPTPRRNANTSIVLFSGAARVARAS